jgi:hypothetical protein
MRSDERAKVSRALGRVKHRLKSILGHGGRTPALLTRPDSRYIRAMAETFRCTICDLEESRCQCDKYCFMCQGGHDVRLCQDGMYYCLECREACDLQAQN